MKYNENKNKNKESYLENDYATYWIDNGIIYEIFKPEITKADLKMAQRVVEDRLKVSNGVTRPILVDLANLKTADKEAREYFAGKEAVHLVSASAFLINSYVLLVLGKLFLTINKPETKIELFKDQSKAVKWLEYYRDLN